MWATVDGIKSAEVDLGLLNTVVLSEKPADLKVSKSRKVKTV